MKKKKICIIILVLVVLAGIAVSLLLFMPRRYYIPDFTLDIFDETAEDSADHFIENKRYYDFTKVYADKDGNLVFVLDREEQGFFENYLKDILVFYEYEKKKENFFIEYSGDYTKITCKCKKGDFDEKTSELLVNQIIYYASWYQAFLGVKPEDNKVSLQVIDIDTNEVIYEKSIGAQ